MTTYFDSQSQVLLFICMYSLRADATMQDVLKRCDCHIRSIIHFGCIKFVMFSGVHGCGAEGINCQNERGLQKVSFKMYHLFFLKFSHLPCELRYGIYIYISLLMVPEFIILFASDVCYTLLVLFFSPLKLSGNKSKCHYQCSKNGVGIIILSFKKSTYLLL